jgi:c-di-GMP-binding flagellar brake protein YcgR
MFARVEMSAHVVCSTLEPGYDWSCWRDKLPWQKTHLKDISAGGLAVGISDACQPEALFVLNVDFFEEVGLPRYVIAKCVRVFTIERQRYCGLHFVLTESLGNTVPRELLSVLPSDFTRFDRHAQDKLANYLFKKQVEQRQKGLI